ncbi:hypothetical protein PIB30_050808 [Stylosanthes scabra]|uniref:Uncharacterized protein n=1 Tax=Stylosanthes scabra TaxID=79078 RepID=A0ABU6SHK4_9FABA|nr:hypothetical protein [Stylosanthes scabra]
MISFGSEYAWKHNSFLPQAHKERTALIPNVTPQYRQTMPRTRFADARLLRPTLLTFHTSISRNLTTTHNYAAENSYYHEMHRCFAYLPECEPTV